MRRSPTPASPPHEIDASFLSLFNNGFSAQDFPASLVLQHVPELRFKPITRFENACASGSAAVYGARDFLLAGRGRLALVIGVEKMTATPGQQVGDILLKASYQKEEADIPAGFAGVFGRIAEKYFQRYLISTGAVPMAPKQARLEFTMKPPAGMTWSLHRTGRPA